MPVMENPRPQAGGAGASENVGADLDTPKNIEILRKLQLKLLRDRFGLTPLRAGLVASLAWPGSVA